MRGQIQPFSQLRHFYVIIRCRKKNFKKKKKILKAVIRTNDIAATKAGAKPSNTFLFILMLLLDVKKKFFKLKFKQITSRLPRLVQRRVRHFRHDVIYR